MIVFLLGGSGRVDVLVAVVVGVPRPLVLEVLLVVVGEHVLVGGRLRLRVGARELPQVLVDQVPLLVLVDVHVGHWRQLLLLLLRAGGSAPVGLDALYVPLVHHCHNLLALASFVEVSEDALVPGVHEDSLLLGSDLAEQGHHEVGPAAVHRLGEGLSSPGAQDLGEVVVVTAPGILQPAEDPGPPEDCGGVHVGFVPERLDGDWVEVDSSEVDLGITLLGCLQGELGLQAGSEGREVGRQVGSESHGEHPEVVAQSEQDAAQVVIVGVLLAGEAGTDFSETALIADLY